MADTDVNAALDKLIRAFRIIQSNIPKEIPFALAQTFLVAARYEGSTVSEIKERTDGNLSTVSRHLLDLSENLRNGEPGYGLLNRIHSPTDRRSVIFELTKKGRLVSSQVRDVMEA